jgi:hypothetical protein
MPNIPTMGNFGNLLATQDRLNQQQGFLNYDPNGYVNPAQFAPYQASMYSQMMNMYQQQARAMFNMNNPQMALPQNLGGALGQLASRALVGSPPQQQPSQPQQQGTQPDPVTQMILARRTMYLRGGMQLGEAQARAAEDLMRDPQAAQDPNASMIAQRAYQEAVDKLHYDPKVAQEKAYSTENFINPDTHEVKSFQVGSPQWGQAIEEQWPKAGDVPQEPEGKTQSYDENGLITTERFHNGTPHKIATSSQPVQYGVTATGTPSQVAGAFPNGPKVFGNADAAEITKDLTNRSIAAKNAIDGIDTVTDMLNRDPNAIGKAGDVLEKVNNWRSEVASLAKTAGFDPGSIPMTASFAQKSAPYIDRFRKAGIDATKWNGMMTDLAYTIEATQGNTNTDPSSRASRIEQIKEDILGDRSSDSEAVKGSLAQQRSRLISSLNNEFEGKPGVMEKPEWLKKENARNQTVPTPPPAPGQPYSDPDKEARYQAWKKAHGYT